MQPLTSITRSPKLDELPVEVGGIIVSYLGHRSKDASSSFAFVNTALYEYLNQCLLWEEEGGQHPGGCQDRQQFVQFQKQRYCGLHRDSGTLEFELMPEGQSTEKKKTITKHFYSQDTGYGWKVFVKYEPPLVSRYLSSAVRKAKSLFTSSPTPAERSLIMLMSLTPGSGSTHFFIEFRKDMLRGENNTIPEFFVPSIGYTCHILESYRLHKMEYENLHSKLAPLLRLHFFPAATAFILVVSALDLETYSDVAHDKLQELEAEAELKDVPFVILVTHQDCANAWTPREVVERLGLNIKTTTTTNDTPKPARKIGVFGVCLTKGGLNVAAAMEWLIQNRRKQ